MKLVLTEENFKDSGVEIRESEGFNRIILIAGDEEVVIPIDDNVNLDLLNKPFSLSQARASKSLRIITSQKCGDNSIILIGAIQAERGYSLKVYNPYGFEGELLYQREKPTSHSGWLLYVVAVIRPQNNLVLEEHLVSNNHPSEFIIYTNEAGKIIKKKISQKEYEALLKEQDREWGDRIL
jgi:hypothetical protein